MKSKVAVKALEWAFAKDPTFNAGETHAAKATLTNQTSQALTCTTELYLDVTKVATSGVSSSFTLPAGGSIDVSYVVPMPGSPGGPYHVYIDIWSGGALLAHYQATDDVTVVTEPSNLDYENISISLKTDPEATAWMGLVVTCNIKNIGNTTMTRQVTLWRNWSYPGYGSMDWAPIANVAGYFVGSLSVTLAPGQVYNYALCLTQYPYDVSQGISCVQFRDDHGGASAQVCVSWYR